MLQIFIKLPSVRGRIKPDFVYKSTTNRARLGSPIVPITPQINREIDDRPGDQCPCDLISDGTCVCSGELTGVTVVLIQAEDVLWVQNFHQRTEHRARDWGLRHLHTRLELLVGPGTMEGEQGCHA